MSQRNSIFPLNVSDNGYSTIPEWNTLNCHYPGFPQQNMVVRGSMLFTLMVSGFMLLDYFAFLCHTLICHESGKHEPGWVLCTHFLQQGWEFGHLWESQKLSRFIQASI